MNVSHLKPVLTPCPELCVLNRVVCLWKEKLATTNQKAAQSLADPAEYENLFPGLQEAVRAEQLLKRERAQLLPANTYSSVTVSN